MDYECLCGNWEGPLSSSSAPSGNANSATGAGHGRAVGPKGMLGLVPGAGMGAGAGAGAELGMKDEAGSGLGLGSIAENGGSLPVGEAAAEAAAPTKVHPAARKPGLMGEALTCACCLFPAL